MKTKSLLTILLFCHAPLLAQNEIRLRDAYILAVPDAAAPAGAFLSVSNDSDQPLRIVGARSSAARTVELHTHATVDGMMQMRPVAAIEIPARSTITLQPGGFHLMLLNLPRRLNPGEQLPIILVFDDGREIEHAFSIRRAEDSPHLHGDGGHGHAAHGAAHDGHAGHNIADHLPPAGVMGAHMHSPGTWIVDYRLMLMQMNHLLDGKTKQSPQQTLFGIYRDPRVMMPMTGLAPPSPLLPPAGIEENQFRYMSVGQDMSMEMHMIDVMYQFSEDTMLMLMVPYMRSRMSMLANNFQTANMSAKGVGDLSFSALFRVRQFREHQLFSGGGLSLPTGSIDERDWMPQMGRSPVAYAMQPGVGTPSALLQIGYSGRADRFSWGAQLDGVLRVGKNDNNYRVGNRYTGTAWSALRLADWISASLRVQHSSWDNYTGQDPSLDPMMDPGNDPRLQGGARTDILAGVNLVATAGAFAGARLFFEAGQPIYQHLHGPQMATDWVANVGAMYAL